MQAYVDARISTAKGRELTRRSRAPTLLFMRNNQVRIMRACVVAVTLMGGTAWAVPVGEDGGKCTPQQTVSCADQGGELEISEAKGCECWITTYTPRKVTNAIKGDVGLVPVNDGRGEDTVRAVMGALVQNHRHSVIFLSQSSLVNNTSLDDPNDNVQEFNRRLDPAILMNGSPGVVSWSLDKAYDVERLSNEGLVLKPLTESLRHYFTDAADEALDDVGRAYYKLSDYMAMSGMGFSYGSDRSVDRRGTMCSGLIYDAFTRAGLTISVYTYPLELLNYVAQSTYESVFDQVPGWTAIVGMRSRVANQVVNCFAGFRRFNGGVSCDDTSDTWKGLSGTGTSVAPDNLLRVSQTLESSGSYTDTGASGYGWDRATGGAGASTHTTHQHLSAGNTLTSSAGCTSAGCVSYGAYSTPFYHVELQNLVGGYYTRRQVNL